MQEFGALHCAVNNAGVSEVFTPLHEESIEDWQRVIDTHISGIFYSLKYETPAILQAGGDAIVDISSVFADRGQQPSDYAGAQHGIRGITRSAAEYGNQGIRINDLQPDVIQGVVDRGIPMGQMGTAEEIATAVAILLSDDAAYITGAHLAVDDGFLA